MRTLLSFTIRLSAIVAALAWFGPAAHSQTSVYPVRTVSVLSGYAPYSLDGFVSQPGKFQVQVLTDDVTLANYPVKLKLTLQSSGVRISTSPNYRQAPLYLNGGEMTALGADDLAPLFDPANLAFEGYSKNQYAQTGQLPEGVYRVWVDVVDYYRNVTVSKGVPAIAMVYLARAPQLSFPTDGSSIDPATSLQTRFSWMAYHPANPGAEVVYRFRMWEVKPQGRNPYEVTTASVPVFEEETTANSLLYGPDKPLLQTGSRYVWQVQAIDLQGATRFQNDGKSNALSFTYGTNCPIPSPKIDKVSATSAKLKWDGNLAAQMYRIDYRASDSTRWNTLTSDTPWAQMGPLVPSTSYEATVTAICGETEGETSPIVRFKSSREVNYACGNGTGHTDLSNTEPLPTLYRFDEFRAADFTIEADEVEGADGTFSGTGYALVPYLGFLKMKVVFKNIFINTDRRMVRGQVEFVYDEATGMVIGFGRSKGAQTVTDPVAWLSAGVGQTVAVNADVAGVSVSGNTVTVTLADGSVQTVTVRDSATIVGIINPNGTTAYVADPASGLVYSVPVPGAANGEAADSSPVLPPSVSGQYGCTAVFTPSPATRYGFDRAGTPKNKPDGYFKRSLNGDAAHWKSLPAGGTDYVTVTVDGGCPTDSMRFLRESGLPVPSAPDGKAKRLLLTGTAHGDEELLTAALSTKRTNKDSTVSQTLTEAGALALVSYSPIAKTVKLVSVNGSKNKPTGTADIQKRLNEIYSPAVVSWTVLDGGNIDVPGLATDGFKTSGLALASRYTADMNRVIEAYNARPDNNTLVLFFVDAADGDKLGFMPLTGSYGFIFKLGGNVELLAHELAHGAFNLRHTFSSKSFWRENGPAPVFPERSTPNLLDYAGGTELWKYQWDLVHDPETVWFNFLQSESEGAMNSNPITQHVLSQLAELKQNFGADYLAILHTEACNDASLQAMPKIYDIENINSLNGYPDIKFPNISVPIAGGSATNFSLDKVQVVKDKAKACVVLYFKSSNNITESTLHVTSNATLLDIDAPALYMMDANNPAKKLDCTNKLDTWSQVICNVDGSLNGGLTEKYFLDLIDNLQQCLKETPTFTNSTGSRVHNYTLFKFDDEEDINKLLSGNKRIVDSKGISLNDLKAQLYITDHLVPQSRLDSISSITPPGGEQKIWLHKSVEGHWELKSGTPQYAQDFFENLNGSGMTFESVVNQLFESVKSTADVLDRLSTISYEALDWTAKGIRKAKIPESVYDCLSQDYQSQYSFIFRVVTTYTAPMVRLLTGAMVEVLLESGDMGEYEECLRRLQKGELDFAYACGLWNGAVEIVASVPDLIKLLPGLLSAEIREEFKKTLRQIQNFKKEDEKTGEILCTGTWCMVTTCLGEMFDPKNCCQFAETMGETALPIVLSFINPAMLEKVAESSAGKVILQVVKTLKWLDNLADIGSLATSSLRYVNKSLAVVRSQANKVMVRIKNGMFEAWVYIDNDLRLMTRNLPEVKLVTEAGEYFAETTENGVTRRFRILASEVGEALKERGADMAKFVKLVENGADETTLFNKLMHSKLANQELNNLLDDLTTSKSFRDYFLNLDVVGTSNKVERITQAWTLCRNSGLTAQSGKRLSSDFLESIEKAMFDSDFMEIIGKGNREEAIRKLKLFAANYVGAINAPGVSGNPSVYLPSDPRVFMDKLVGVTKKFKDIDGVNSFMTEATKALGSQEGIWHVLRNVESLDPKTVSRFDAKFVNTDRPCVECRFDVEMIKGEGQPLKFIEYKSYIAADKIDVPQLLNYLNGVADLSELRYVFAADKLSLEKAKEGMLAVFRKNAESIWEANEILFKGKPIKINDQDYLIMELSDFTDILNHKDALKCSIFDFVTRQ